jgi:ketosteroid isomerase-like protein
MNVVKKIAMLAAVACPLAWMSPAWAADESPRIRAGTKLWVESFNSGNAGAAAALYAEDAVLMPPGAPSARGTVAIKEVIAKEIAGAKKGGVTFTLGTGDEVGISGDLAWHSGAYFVMDKSGKTVDQGKYLETWHKVSGKWRIIRDIWNSDGAVAAQQPAAPKK